MKPALAWGSPRTLMKSPNPALRSWVQSVSEHAKPDTVHFWTGTDAEYHHLAELCARQTSALDNGTERSPVFVATHKRVDAGPTNHWLSVDEARAKIWPYFSGAMLGRTMFVVPCLLGGPRATLCRVAVQITDSPHVALRLTKLLRTGRRALDQLAGSPDFARGVHCLAIDRQAPPVIVHFPDAVETWSIGSGAQANSLLCTGLEGIRLATSWAHEEGWLAEHMTLVALTAPDGDERYFAVAATSDDARSDLADSFGRAHGFELRHLSSDACWMTPHIDGRLWAIDPEAQTGLTASGVPLSGLVFCGKQSRSTPLVYEARSWRHGVYVGGTLTHEVGQRLIHDPMSMLRYCGYNLGDYLAHWLSIGRKLNRQPNVFHLNCFRTSVDGRRLWPGGAENIRVFRWMAERIDGTGAARETPLGYVPEVESFDTQGLDISQDQLEQLFFCNHGALLREAESARRFLFDLGDCLPAGLLREHSRLVRALQESLH